MILRASSSCTAMDGVPERFKDDPATATAPLSAIAEAFEELAKLINSAKLNGSEPYHLRLDTFCDACSLISILFGCLGLAFKFAELEYISKVLFFFSSLVYDLCLFNRFVRKSLVLLLGSIVSRLDIILEYNKYELNNC